MLNRGKIIISFISVFLILILLSLWTSQKVLRVKYYKYENDKLLNRIKIVQLSDLHNYQFGKNNKRLLEKIEKETPDAIFMTGDMLNDDEENITQFIRLIEDASQIAPVYASLGNHEVAYIENYGENVDLRRQMEEAGAIVLEQEYVDTEIAGQQVRIGGVYGYVLAEDEDDGSEQRFMEKFEDTDRFKILLSHMSEGLLLWKSLEKWKVDIVFSGHIHGGQVRLPIIGGLYAQEEGFFPTYTKGMFELGNGTLILSAGLGSSRGIPRVNNLPEIVVCEMQGES